jgi:hypothetical protein
MEENRMRKLISFAIVVGLLLIGGISVGLILSRGATATSPLSSTALGILARSAMPSDRLPPGALDLPSAQEYDLQGARLSQTVNGRELFVVPNTDGSICLVVSSSDETMSNCGSPTQLANGALYLEQPATNGMMQVWGIVGDGITAVGGTQPVANTFAYIGPQRQQLSISSGAETRTLDLGDLTPPVP